MEQHNNLKKKGKAKKKVLNLKEENSLRNKFFFPLVWLCFVFFSSFVLFECFTKNLGAQTRETKQKERKDLKNQKSLKKADKKSGKLKFSEAYPEDITNENFPDIIESFDYPNTNLEQLIKAISKLTKKNFMIDSGVRGKKISIIAPSPITVAEAYKAFLSALAMNDLTVVPTMDGKFLKIRKTSTATYDSIETYSGDYFPNFEQLITYILRLKYISTKDVIKNLKDLKSKGGKIIDYSPTNSLIITDYGSNIERIRLILEKLDVPGFEEKMKVIRVFYAEASEIEKLINTIFNKRNSSSSRRSRFSKKSKSRSERSNESFSLITSDKRTNSLIVVATPAGLRKVESLVRKLDIEVDPDSSGVFVYYVRHGTAEDIAKILNGVISSKAEKSSNDKSQKRQRDSLPNWNSRNFTDQSEDPGLGKNIKVIADKTNNSLLITGSRQDFVAVKNILEKIDIPRDQVFVRVIILDMKETDSFEWKPNYLAISDGPGVNAQNSKVISGFSPDGVENLISPSTGDSSNSFTPGIIGGLAGTVLGIGTEVEWFKNKKYRIESLFGFIRWLKKNGDATILSRPQVTVMDNEEATIEFGEEVPVGRKAIFLGNNSQGLGEQTYRDGTMKLTFTPFISSESDLIRLKIEQTHNKPIFTGEAYTFQKRVLNSTVIVKNGDTAVLGGLMENEKSEAENKVPILGDLPLIGWLFKGKKDEAVKRNVFAFLTPQIIRSSSDNESLLRNRIDILEKGLSSKQKKKGQRRIDGINKLIENSHSLNQELESQRKQEMTLDAPKPSYSKNSDLEKESKAEEEGAEKYKEEESYELQETF